MAMDQQNRQQGTGFVNLQQYLKANQPDQVAGAVSQGLQKDTQQAQQQIGQQQQQFNQAAEAGKLGTAQDVNQESDILGRLDTQGGAGVTSQDVSDFNRFRSGAYGGPQGLANAQGIQSKAADVQGAGQALGTQGGRFGLLQRYLGQGKQYSTGQQGLDATLLGAGGGKQLAQAAQGTFGLQQQAQNASNLAQQQAQTYQGQAQAFGQQATGAIQGRQTGLTNQLTQEQQQAAAAQNAAYQQQAQQLGQNQISAQLAQQLGITQGQQLYDLNLGQFATQASGPTISSIANQGELAKANALAQLAGQQGGQNIISDASQVGTFNPNNISNFNQQQFQQALGNRQQQLQQATQQQTQNVYNDPNNGIADAAIRAISPSGWDYNGIKADMVKAGGLGGYINQLQQLAQSAPFDFMRQQAQQKINTLNQTVSGFQGQLQQSAMNQLGYNQTANILPDQGQ